VVLERDGVRTVTIVTDKFVDLATAQATSLNKRDLALVVVPHPVGGLKEKEVEARAKDSIEKLARLLLEPGLEERVVAPFDQEVLPERLSFGDDPEAAEYFYQHGLTDGLPVVLPTAENVDRFMSHMTKQLGNIVGKGLPPRRAPITAEKVAINAVMAGCLPEYLPVILTALEAALDPGFNLNGILCTTHPCAVLAIVNGPIAEELGINSGHNCFGQGWRANATIGRALGLCFRNIGGAIPGSTDKATQGNPGKYSYCVAENEKESPWEPFHVERGFPKDVSTVTVVSGESPHNINDHGSISAEGILTTVAGTMAATGNNNVYNQADTFVFLGPEHAATVAKDGFGKEDARQFLFQRARIPVSKMAPKQLAHIKSCLSDSTDYINENQTIGIVRDAADIRILVAGGSGKHSAWVPTFGIGTYSVTRPIL
jgi:hypothetical protein